MNGFVIRLLTMDGTRFYSTMKGDFFPVACLEYAERFYYAHAAEKVARELMKSSLGRDYIIAYRVVAL